MKYVPAARFVSDKQDDVPVQGAPPQSSLQPSSAPPHDAYTVKTVSIAEVQVSTLSVPAAVVVTLYQMSLPGEPQEGTVSDEANDVSPRTDAAPSVSVVAVAQVSFGGGPPKTAVILYW
jgi:hypothetical protein